MNETRKILDTETKSSSSSKVEVGKDIETKPASAYYEEVDTPPTNYIVSMTEEEVNSIDLNDKPDDELGTSVSQAIAFELSSNPESDVSKGIGTTIRSGYQNTMLNNCGRNAIRDDEDNVYNHIQYGEKSLNIRPLSFRSTGGVTKSNIGIIISNHIKSGDMIQIPLWHSGFHITVRPMTLQDSIDLQREIATKSSELGYKTFGYMYNSDTSLTTKVILDLISRKIQSTTLQLEEGDDVFDYVSVYDVNPLILGFLRATYPSGVEMIRMNGSEFELDKQGKVQEPMMTKTLVDLSKLLWVNTNRLDRDMYNIMCKTTPNSITQNDMIEYKKHVYSKLNKTYEHTIEDEFGNKYIFGLKMPSINEYMESSEHIINNIIKDVNRVSKKSDKLTEEEQLTYMVYKNKYHFFAHFIEYIKIINTDGEERKFTEHLYEAIDTISDILPHHFYLEYVSMINKYVDKGTIALVAIPRKALDKEENLEEKSKEILIPFNILTFFFLLNNKRLTNLAK